MNLTVMKGGPEPELVPVLHRREEVERALKLYRQSIDVLREAETSVLTAWGLTDQAIREIEGDVRYLSDCLAQKGDFIVLAWEGAEPEDWQTPELVAAQRCRNAALGAADFVPPADLPTPSGGFLGRDKVRAQTERNPGPASVY